MSVDAYYHPSRAISASLLTNAALRPLPFQDEADGVREAHWVVRCVGREQEHRALGRGKVSNPQRHGKRLACTYLLNVDIPELSLVDNTKKHRALVLVEPFLVQVSPTVYHDPIKSLRLTSVSFT